MVVRTLAFILSEIQSHRGSLSRGHVNFERITLATLLKIRGKWWNEGAQLGSHYSNPGGEMMVLELRLSDGGIKK